MTLYLRALSSHGMAVDARAKLKQLILKRLGRDGGADEEMGSLMSLIRALTRSFGKETENGVITSLKDETEKAAFLRELCDSAPGSLYLPEMIISDPLVKSEYLGPFYEMLIRGSEDAPRFISDLDFIERLRKRVSWTLEEVEESLDHERSRSETPGGFVDLQAPGSRLDWYHNYLDYLISKGRNIEAIRLIPKIEQVFKGRFTRPVWLRLAKLRLDIRQRPNSQALAGFKRFAGVEASPKLETIAPPDIERLNKAVEALRDEKRFAAADQLLRAAYERNIALEQFQISSFAELARMAFEEGDSNRGLILLRLLVELGDSETRDTAAAEVASLAWVKTRAITAEWIERTEPSNQIDLAEALRVAAETAAKYEKFAVAVEYRKRLLAIAPEDSANRLELARALPSGGTMDEALSALASLISDRRAPRLIRWTSVWVAPEIIKRQRWPSFEQQIRAGKDQEMVAAVEALSFLGQRPIGRRDKPSQQRDDDLSCAAAEILPSVGAKERGTRAGSLEIIARFNDRCRRRVCRRAIRGDRGRSAMADHQALRETESASRGVETGRPR